MGKRLMTGANAANFCTINLQGQASSTKLTRLTRDLAKFVGLHPFLQLLDTSDSTMQKSQQLSSLPKLLPRLSHARALLLDLFGTR